MLTLLVLQGPDKGQRFELPETLAVIGRGASHVPLLDNTVSRKHCEVVHTDGNYVLRDLGSANGTYINGLKVRSPQAIRVGDQLRIGRTLMVFGTVPGFSGGKIRDADVEFTSSETGGSDSAIMHTIGANDDSMILAVPDPSAAAVSNLQILYRLGMALGSSFDIDQAMGITMDLVFEHVRAERGLIMLRHDEASELRAVVVRRRDADEVTPAAADTPRASVRASRTIIDHVITRGEGVLSSNAMADQRFTKGKSVHDMGIRSAICVPIKAKKLAMASGTPDPTRPLFDTLGVLYIDTSVKNFTYSPDQLRLLSAVGLQAGMAIQNAKLYQAGISAERLTAIGETTAALSHSIKNILQALRGGADVVEMGLAASNLDQAGKGWGIVNRNLDKIYSLTMNLLAFSGPRTPDFEHVAPGKVIRDVVETVAASAADRGVMVVADCDDTHPPVPLDTSGMHQVLHNLVGNAMDAVTGGNGLVRVVSRYAPATDEAIIQVIDNGPGIAPTMRDHLFELFHSTKGNRGTGLGLAVSRKIVEEHGGSLTAEQNPAGGTVFTVRLPAKELVHTADPSATHSPR